MREFRHSISVKLFLSILALSAAATLLTTGLRSYRTYQSELSQVGAQMEHLQQSYLPALRESLWTMDRQQIQIILDGISLLPHIRSAAVRSTDGRVACEAGFPQRGDAASGVTVRQFDVSHTAEDRQILLGTFEVVADLPSMASLAMRDLSSNILDEGLKILVLSACALLIFRLMVTRHLVAMAAFTRNLDIRVPQPPLGLRRRARRSTRDELDDVVASLNETVRGLRTSFERLTESNTSLERMYQERLRTEDALRQSERRLADAQRIASVGSWDYDVDSNHRTWSDEMYRIYGFEAGREVSTAAVLDRIHPDDRDQFRADLWKGLQRGSDYRIVLPDGTVRFIHEEIRVEEGPAGSAVRYWGTAQDVTARKVVEEDLLRSREFVRKILDSVDEGFIVIDRDYRILSANSAYCREVNAASDEVVGSECYRVSHHRDSPCHEAGERCAVREAFETGQPATCAHAHDGPGGTVHVEMRAFPLKDERGNVTSVIAVSDNVTQRDFLEEQLLKTQKLEAVGVLAGGIAHDFNNLLQGVFGHLSLARLRAGQDPELLQLLEKAQTALDLSRALARQLLAFAKGGEPVRKTISLTPVVRTLLRFVVSGSTVSCEFSAPEELWTVEADEGQISQVVQNIVLNAVQAMPGGGTVRVEMSNVTLDGRSLLLVPPGRYVRISVADSGDGISTENLSRIFDPYFTTKQKGCGLGLATAYTIVHRHGGAIDVRSTVGAGSTFFIHLPASEKSLPATRKVEDRPPQGRGRILIMDDEETVRTTAAAMVKALGYRFALACNGEEAIAACRARPRRERSVRRRDPRPDHQGRHGGRGNRAAADQTGPRDQGRGLQWLLRRSHHRAPRGLRLHGHPGQAVRALGAGQAAFRADRPERIDREPPDHRNVLRRVADKPYPRHLVRESFNPSIRCSRIRSPCTISSISVRYGARRDPAVMREAASRGSSRVGSTPAPAYGFDLRSAPQIDGVVLVDGIGGHDTLNGAGMERRLHQAMPGLRRRSAELLRVIGVDHLEAGLGGSACRAGTEGPDGRGENHRGDDRHGARHELLHPLPPAHSKDWRLGDFGRLRFFQGVRATPIAAHGLAASPMSVYPRAGISFRTGTAVGGGASPVSADVPEGRGRDGARLVSLSKAGFGALAAGRLEEAGRWFRELLLADSSNSYALVGLAETARAKGDLRSALGAYEQCVGFHPDNPRALGGLFECLRELEELPRAVEVWESRLRNGRPTPMVCTHAGDLYRRLGRFEDSRAAYQRALDQEPANRYALNGMAQLNFDSERYEDARVFWERAREAAPDDIRVLTSLGNCYRKTRQLRGGPGLLPGGAEAGAAQLLRAVRGGGLLPRARDDRGVAAGLGSPRGAGARQPDRPDPGR